jgi:importin subunit beta-1
LIAAIAQIEIPRGEWTELIANLCTNATHEDKQVKLTSLITIGYICEELKPEDLT